MESMDDLLLEISWELLKTRLDFKMITINWINDPKSIIQCTRCIEERKLKMENIWPEHGVAVKILKILVDHKTENQQQSEDPGKIVDAHF